MRFLPAWVRDSVRAQLVVLFFTITAGAVGFVYLYVVPQLSSSLTAERLERLELAGADERQRFERAAADGRRSGQPRAARAALVGDRRCPGDAARRPQRRAQLRAR